MQVPTSPKSIRALQVADRRLLRTQDDPGVRPAWTGPCVVALLVAVFVARLAYLAWDCPLDLSPDEAHYWDWSRHLDWSYYSKGPLVAWLIHVSCAAFGDLAVATTGTLMPAIRLPAVLCGSLTLWGLFTLTRRVYCADGLALGVVLGGLTLPVLAAGSLLMTIDAPFVCCWTWALVVAHRLTQPGGQARVGGWVLFGLLVGVGILAKYTMVLFLPSLCFYFVVRTCCAEGTEGNLLVRLVRSVPAGFWLACGVAAACCLPIVVWNAQHGWVTLNHVGRQAGVQGQSTWQWLGPLEYGAGQFALLLGFWFVGYVAAMLRTVRDLFARCAGQSEVFLFCLSIPTFLVFLAFSVRTKVEMNWPVTAYLAGLVLTAGWIARQCTSPTTWWRRLSCASLALAVALGLLTTMAMHRTDWFYPDSGQGVARIRQWDPNCRLRGWQTLAAQMRKVRDELRGQGIEPILAGAGWALPGAIGVYQEDHPEVYSFARANGGRFSQYDFWRPNPVSDPDQFLGQTVVYVGEVSPQVREAFNSAEEPTWAVHEVKGHEVARWPVTVLRGFRGFKQLAATGY